MFGIQVRHVNEAIPATIASTEVSTNSMLGTFGICIMAVIEDHELDVTKDCFNWVVIRAAFGQAEPMEMQFTHNLTSKPRFARMSTVLVQDDPQGNVRIPGAKVI